MINSSNRTYNAKLNMFSSLILQIVLAISGLVVPRLIIPTYGSEINGLIVSITQYISYITLLEAGVGSVFRASLYMPIKNKNIEAISGIINEQKRFYRNIGIAFIIYIIVLCIAFPYIIKSEQNHCFIIVLVLILSVGTFLEYFVSLPYQSLIIADQRIRIINNLSSLVIISNIILTVVLVNLGVNIIILKFSTCIIALIKPVFYVVYTNKHFKLDKSAKPDKVALKQRWNGMVHHFAFYIHRNTDVILLSIFVGASIVSVYSIYLAIAMGIEKIITSVSNGIGASIGNLLADAKQDRINKTIDIFEFVQISLTTILYTVAGLLLMPFINLYTAKMNDTNYIEPLFGYLLLIAEAIYCIRCIYSTVSMNGNKFKETQIGAVLESVINLIVSLALLFVFNSISGKLLAIVIGTICGMSVRLIFELRFLKYNLVFRSPSKFFKNFIINIFVSFIGIVICINTINYNCGNVIDWVIKGAITFFVVSSEGFLIYFLFNRTILFDCIKRLSHKYVRS